MRNYNPDEDVYLKKYPQAKRCPRSTPGYAYDFGENFSIYKNITGTGGWILAYKVPGEDKYTTYPYAVEFDEAVKIAEEKLNV